MQSMSSHCFRTVTERKGFSWLTFSSCADRPLELAAAAAAAAAAASLSAALTSCSARRSLLLCLPLISSAKGARASEGSRGVMSTSATLKAPAPNTRNCSPHCLVSNVSNDSSVYDRSRSHSLVLSCSLHITETKKDERTCVDMGHQFAGVMCNPESCHRKCIVPGHDHHTHGWVCQWVCQGLEHLQHMYGSSVCRCYMQSWVLSPEVHMTIILTAECVSESVRVLNICSTWWAGAPGQKMHHVPCLGTTQW